MCELGEIKINLTCGAETQWGYASELNSQPRRALEVQMKRNLRLSLNSHEIHKFCIVKCEWNDEQFLVSYNKKNSDELSMRKIFTNS